MTRTVIPRLSCGWPQRLTTNQTPDLKMALVVGRRCHRTRQYICRAVDNDANSDERQAV